MRETFEGIQNGSWDISRPFADHVESRGRRLPQGRLPPATARRGPMVIALVPLPILVLLPFLFQLQPAFSALVSVFGYLSVP